MLKIDKSAKYRAEKYLKPSFVPFRIFYYFHKTKFRLLFYFYLLSGNCNCITVVIFEPNSTVITHFFHVGGIGETLRSQTLKLRRWHTIYFSVLV